MPHTQAGLPWQGRAPVARQSSYDAAVTAEAFAPAQRDRLYAFYLACGEQGATDAEVEVALGLRPNLICARRNELVDAGFVVALLQRRVSVRSRCRVVAWAAVERL